MVFYVFRSAAGSFGLKGEARNSACYVYSFFASNKQSS